MSPADRRSLDSLEALENLEVLLPLPPRLVPEHPLSQVVLLARLPPQYLVIREARVVPTDLLAQEVPGLSSQHPRDPEIRLGRVRLNRHLQDPADQELSRQDPQAPVDQGVRLVQTRPNRLRVLLPIREAPGVRAAPQSRHR